MKRVVLFLGFLAAAFGQTASMADHQISGIVVDHLTNHPLNHVLVEISRISKGGGDASALTEADGRFTFLHVPEGKYRLSAEKRSQTPEGYQSDAGFATAIVVDGRQKTDGIVFAMRTDASINGVVVSDNGDTVRNAQVGLFRQSVNDGEAQVIQLRGAGTNSSGQFHFGHLDAGNYYLSVQATPWYEANGRAQTVYPITFYGDTTDADSARVISLPEGGALNLQINLHAVPGIRVKLSEGARGAALFIRGPGGTQIPVPAQFEGGGQHTVLRGGARLYTRYAKESLDAPDVSMELSNFPAGHYQVQIFGENGGPGPSVENLDVDLVDGTTLSLQNAAACAISGKVIFDGARPHEDLEVSLGSGQGRGLIAKVAADGTFKFARAESGKFQVFLNSPELTISSLAVQGGQMVHETLEVPSAAAVELTIHTVTSESLSTLEGFAVRNGSGVAGAMVLLLPQDLGSVRLLRRDQSDGDGSFTLPNVLPGRYTLTAIDDGRDLAYKNETMIKPYLEGGLAISIPLKSDTALKVPVQARKR